LAGLLNRIFPTLSPPVSYRGLRAINHLLIIASEDEAELTTIIPYLRKDDLLITPNRFGYFTTAFSHFHSRHYQRIDEIRAIVKELRIDGSILINLNPRLASLPDLNRFPYRVGRFPDHRFPEFNILIRDGLTAIFPLLKRKAKKRVRPNLDPAKRRKIISFYRKCYQKGYERIIYVKERLPTPELSVFYILEGSTTTTMENVKTIPGGDYESLLYCYYADDYYGPPSFHKFFRSQRR